MFKNLFTRKRKQAASAPFSGAPVQPNGPVAVVGDIHGNLACLDQMIRHLHQRADHMRWVFVGDFVDRGDHSAEVLNRLHQIGQSRPESVFLLGNHEEMMLDFLAQPIAAGNRWMLHGGLQTMASFGVSGLRPHNDKDSLLAARDHLAAVLSEDLLDWLRSLPRYWASGNLAIVHAGADPFAAINKQPQAAFTWGHPDFRKHPRADGIWVVHGHTIMPAPQVQDGVISIDTGAYAHHRLTAALIADGEVQFLQATPSKT